MINRLLSYNYSAILIFLFALIIKVILYYSGSDFSHNYQASIIDFGGLNAFWSGLWAALFSVLIGLNILISAERYAKRTDFSLWIVLIFVLLLNFYGFYDFGPEHIGLLAFTSALHFLFRGLQMHDPRRMVLDCFNLSFILALGSFFTPHLVFLIPLFWLCRVLNSHFSFKSTIASLLGFTLPFLIVDSLIFSFFSDQAQMSSHYLLEQIIHTHQVSTPRPWTWTQLANIGPLVLLIFSFIITFSNVVSTKIIIRKYNRINAIILIYFILLIITGIVPMHWGMMMLFVPASYFFSNLQIHNHFKWRKIVMSVIFISALLSYPIIMDGIINFIAVFF